MRIQNDIDKLQKLPRESNTGWIGSIALKFQKNTSLELERKRSLAAVSGQAGRVILKSVTGGSLRL